ncbi:hypothetical protein [uncultured Arcticibacterium sp.]|uniref:hypothetical protein n=1 Tax=uncultured Arcticibacterium sp. TaxID=2173042 RepID=UPI0030F4C75E
MRQFLALLGISFFFFSCEKSEVSTPERQRLVGYKQVYTYENKTDIYSGVYNYDQNGYLIIEAKNDTSYSNITGQITPVKVTHEYFYNTEGYLVRKYSEAQSITLVDQAEVNYSYKNELLSLEDFNENVREYRYDNQGKLSTTIFTNKFSGNKTIVDYNNDIPLNYVKTNEGFTFSKENENTFLDSDLLLKRYEKYSKNELIFEQDYTLQKSGLPESALPTFKGFPKIKAFDYRIGIEKEIVTHKTINGVRILSDERTLNPEFDQNGYLIRNSGQELLNQETDNPIFRDLLFEYYYEVY